MGERGPLGQSAQLRVITGIKKKSQTAPLNDALRPNVGVPDCPDYLLPDAKTEWYRITPELKQLQIISHIDMAALAMYCQTYAQWVLAQRKIKELGEDGVVDVTPNGFRQLGAWYIASSKAFEQMRSMLAEFGLSPLTRARIAPNICTNVGTTLDIFDGLAEENESTGSGDRKLDSGRFFTR